MLSVLLLVVGGGFGPPLIGLVLGIAALSSYSARPPRSGRRPPQCWNRCGRLLGFGVADHLGLSPGTAHCAPTGVWRTPAWWPD